jgi:hypothetical protein
VKTLAKPAFLEYLMTNSDIVGGVSTGRPPEREKR